MVHISLVPALTPLYLYVNTFRSMCAVPNMAVFCSSLTSWFPGMLLTYFLNDFEMVPVAPIITGITFVFTVHMSCISIVRSLYFRIFFYYSLLLFFIIIIINYKFIVLRLSRRSDWCSCFWDVTSRHWIIRAWRFETITSSPKGRVSNAQRNANFKLQVLESNGKLENVFLIQNLKL